MLPSRRAVFARLLAATAAGAATWRGARPGRGR